MSSMAITSQLSLKVTERDLVGLIVETSFTGLVVLAFFFSRLAHFTSLIKRFEANSLVLLLDFLFISRA